MKPKIKWIYDSINGDEHHEASWDIFWLFCYRSSRTTRPRKATAFRAYVGKYRDGHTFKGSFNSLEEAKAWCESQLPHLIAEEICDET
jgi:hypothetical protein